MFKWIINRILLFPYYSVLVVRNYLYDKGIFGSKEYDIPTICVGNITVGGTGKTPHTEYFIRELQNDYKIAVVSRGYGRKSRGLRFVECSDTVSDSGDEPLQIKRKFPNITVVVDGNRRRAIERLRELPEEERPQLIILDDAFQHRSVKPTVSILLIDYNRPLASDMLMPIGRLRDLPSQIKRADYIIATKCPGEPDFEMRQGFMERERINRPDRLFFSMVEYCEPSPLFTEADRRYLYSKFSLVITGIANPSHLVNQLRRNYKIEGTLSFGDHHNFSSRDISKINRWCSKYQKSVIYTTEKDAQRLSEAQTLSPMFKGRAFFLPIKVTVFNNFEDKSIVYCLKRHIN